MNITFKDKNLFLNGKTVTLETNIDNVVVFEQVCIVLLMDDLVRDLMKDGYLRRISE